MRDHLRAERAVAGVKLEERLAQRGFVVRHTDDLPILFPDADPAQRSCVEQRVGVHVLPGWLEPVAILVAGLEVGDQEAAHPAVIGGVSIAAKCDSHSYVIAQIWISCYTTYEANPLRSTELR